MLKIIQFRAMWFFVCLICFVLFWTGFLCVALAILTNSPQTQKSTCLCLPSDGIKSVYQHCPAQGNVYVKCLSIAVAITPVNELHGKGLAGKMITAAYVPLPTYHNLFPDSVLPKHLLHFQNCKGFADYHSESCVIRILAKLILIIPLMEYRYL